MTAHVVTLNDGYTMPRLGYGVWQLGNREAVPLVKTAIDVGFRHVDTAQAYFNEEAVGQALLNASVPRAELFITTKLRGRDMGFDAAMRSFDESMKRLGLDYLDLFLIHWPMPARNQYVETWKAFIRLKESGRVRSIGVSNFTAAHIDRLVKETGVTPAVNQIEVHPFFPQTVVRAHHEKHGIVIESYSPLGGSGSGLLKNEFVRSVAAKHGKSPAQIVIRWHLQQGLAPLPKTATASRLPENLAVWDFTLDAADIANLGKLARANGNTQPSPDNRNSPF